MRVTQVRLFNWLRYSGEHTLDLAADIYAVTASFEHDSRRSNWAGKTSLLEAIRFALYGVHRGAREDDWITEGEASGYVEVTLDSGTLLRRSRRRGKSTLLEVVVDDASATGELAQARINEIVGLSREDFEATCWIGQKMLARLVLARPGERFEIVSGWAGLEPLQRCEERTRLLLSDVTTEIHSAESIVLASERTLIEARIQNGLAASTPIGDVLIALDDVLEKKAADMGAAALVVEAAKEALAAAHERQHHADRAVELEEVAESLKTARSKFEALPEVDATLATSALADARAKMQAAGAEVKTKAALARGEFDGRCPVGGIVCPAKNDLNRMAAENRVEHKRALSVYDDSCRAESIARSEQEDAARVDREKAGLLGQREKLRERYAALREATKAPLPDGPDVVEAREKLTAATDAYRKAADVQATARAAFETAQNAMLDRARMQDTVDKAKDQATLLRAALRVFGRQGAQQRIAEAALAEIEQGANALLRDAGIDLSVEMRWAREAASGLATTCDACGAPFPASQRAKKCERCGAERPPKLIERLDVELSDRSGAAEDLAGAALQLAAAAWLRRERDVRWSVALIDEPFGALDEANRRQFAAHLVQMLRGRFGFEQAFIVAHSPDVLDAMPRQIRVTADEYGSTLKVA